MVFKENETSNETSNNSGMKEIEFEEF